MVALKETYGVSRGFHNDGHTVTLQSTDQGPEQDVNTHLDGVHSHLLVRRGLLFTS
jgi:hypothetical protein